MQNKSQEDGDLNLNVILSYLVRYWKWFAVSVGFCLIIAFCYLRCATKVYNASAKVLMQDKEKGTFSSQADVLNDFGFQGVNTSVENEIEVLCSKSVVKGAVLNTGLYIRYSVNGFCSDKPIYKNDSPLQIAILEEDLMNLKSPIVVRLTMSEDSVYNVAYIYENISEGLQIESEPEKITKLPYLLKTVKGDLLLSENEGVSPCGDMTITVNTLDAATAFYKGSLSVQPTSKTASVAIISVNDVVPTNGIEFIDALIASYNHQTNEDKKLIARKTKEFIDGRVDELSEDLARREKVLADYKREQQLINPTIDAPRILEHQSAYTKRLEEVNLAIEQVQYLLDYVNDKKNDKQAIPSVVGLADNAALVSLITTYNKAVAKRKDLLRTATDENPALIAVTEEVENMQHDICDGLETMNKSLLIQRQAASRLAEQYSSRIANTPAIESKLSDLSRERDVKSQLYVMLLQKYEENALAMAVTADNLKCIDSATSSFMPIAPRKHIVILFALIMGVLIPALFLYLRELLRTKVEDIYDVEKLTSLPIIGSIPFKQGLRGKIGAIVVEENHNDMMMEAFRAIRTNLQFLTHKEKGHVIMLTSTTSGEGKTFISSNLAVSLALLGKRVLLMGLDIRCPRLSEVFEVNRMKSGITSFLADSSCELSYLDSLIIPSGVSKNLELLPAGIVPPNPAELLAGNNLDRAIEHLQGCYDYIIMDTAPVGMVTDSLIMSRVADIVVYVARAKFTEKANLEFLNALVADKKLSKTALVLNAEDWEKSKKYGRYKYGYSYYSGYGENAVNDNTK